ncbi:MAG: GNAT family N-acetyltransferase [Sphingomonadales bacterium]|nr:GNAT family N-acetyltransferase [Sphingomonadales bacterium]
MVERAYRGDSARGGWTHEADLLDGERIGAAELRGILANPAQRVILAEGDGALHGCITITDLGDGLAYLGMFAVDPARQAGGLGKALLAEAEAAARDVFGAGAMEMTVIAARGELIAYYERRGYARTGETRDFPEPDRDLPMAVLAKPLR